MSFKRKQDAPNNGVYVGCLFRQQSRLKKNKCDNLAYNAKMGNCEEELPKNPVGRLSVNCRPTVDRQLTDSLPTANQQVTDRLRKKKNCGKNQKNEQLTWHSVIVTYDSTDFTYLPINCYQLLSDAYRIDHLRNLQHTRQSKNRIGR